MHLLLQMIRSRVLTLIKAKDATYITSFVPFQRWTKCGHGLDFGQKDNTQQVHSVSTCCKLLLPTLHADSESRYYKVLKEEKILVVLVLTVFCSVSRGSWSIRGKNMQLQSVKLCLKIMEKIQRGVNSLFYRWKKECLKDVLCIISIYAKHKTYK